MKCEDCRETLAAYAAGETTAAETAEIRAHLEDCADCRAEAAEFTALTELLHSLPEEDLPAGYHAELMQKIQAADRVVVPFGARKKQPKQPKWKQLSLVAAAVFLVVAAGGINGVLELRQNQNEVIYQTETADNVSAPQMIRVEEAETPQETNTAENTAPQTQQKSVTQAQTNNSAPAQGNTTDAPPVNTTEANTIEANTAEADVPMVASAEDIAPEMYTANGSAENSLYDAPQQTRSLPMPEMTSAVTLTVADVDTALAAVRDAIAAADGWEEEPTGADTLSARIPTAGYAAFQKTLEQIGTADWTKQGSPAAEDAYGYIGIRLETAED